MPNGIRRPDATGASAEPLFPRKNDVLAEICRAIARSGDHREVVQESAVRLQRYFGTHAVAILFESDGDLLVEGMAFPDHLQSLLPEIKPVWDVRTATPDRPAVQAMRRRQILRWEAEDPSLSAEVRALLRRGNARTLIAIPIYVDGDPIGTCMVATPDEKALTAADEALLETALGVVGVVYRRGVLKELEAEHQRQAIQSHHLAAVGELAAGVAHEINNPLNTIVHFAEVLLQQKLSGEAREQVEAIMEEALRAANTVRSLQAFARSESSNARSSTLVEDAIESILDLERHQLAVSNVEVRVDLADGLPPVRANAAHLGRVLHNVISNARHAIDATGAPGEVLIHAERIGRWVEIAVEDTGAGLTPEVADAMFRPFFTTKGAGEGTGLGLAVAYGMVRENGGEIEGTNWGRPRVLGGAPGEGGARVLIRLPADVEPWLPAAQSTSPAPAARVRPLAILLVEDEAQVARSVTALLTREGHRVDTMHSAEEAVARLKSGAPYDVILSDFRMPGIGGEGLCGWIRTEQPELLDRLLFMSGDLLSPRTETFFEGANRPVLAKPFTLAALRSALAPFSRAVSDPEDG
jgi:signal transduction histidine kinase/CheY-like chemotaxis protein